MINAVLLFAVFDWTQWLMRQAQLEVATTWHPFEAYFLPTLMSVLPGICLGIEQLVSEFKKSGHWRLDWLRLLIFGLPALVFTFLIYLYFGGAAGFLPPKIMVYLALPVSTAFGGLVLGYIFITSLRKAENN